MELHTLGVDGGYTQKDIVEVARCFTGWTIDRPNQGGPFTTTTGLTTKAKRPFSASPSRRAAEKRTARRCWTSWPRIPPRRDSSRKNWRSASWPTILRRRLSICMAQTFHDTDGDIRAVMSTMLNSKEFLSQGAYRAKIKTPFEMIVSAVRATGAKLDSAIPLANQLSNLGRTSIPETGADRIFERQRRMGEFCGAAGSHELRVAAHAEQGAGRTGGSKKFATTPAAAAQQLLFTNATAQTLSAIGKAIEDQKKKNPNEAPSGALIAGLVIGSPDFQRR